MSCDEAREQLDMAATGALDEGARAGLREHVAGCLACRDYARRLEGLAATLRAAWPDREPPPALAGRVADAGLAAAGRRRPSLRAWARVAGWAAAAVLLAVALGRWGAPVPRPARAPVARSLRLELPAGTRLARAPEVSIVAEDRR